MHLTEISIESNLAATNFNLHVHKVHVFLGYFSIVETIRYQEHPTVLIFFLQQSHIQTIINKLLVKTLQ